MCPRSCPTERKDGHLVVKVGHRRCSLSRRVEEEPIDAVFGALKEQLSAGEVDDIAAQLPTDLKGVWGQA
jgi:uncharacterized protein (DUF2267 family)